MSSCCESSPTAVADGIVTIALAGNPNSGKTTVFNGLTGLHQKVANYPGVTVERKIGRCHLPDGRRANVIDLPGTYSIIGHSPDERIAMEVLRGLRADTPAPDVVIAIVDASNLQRNLYLVSQLIELGRPLVIALNMMDVARRHHLRVSPQKLERELGVPVVPIVGHKRVGIDELKQAIGRAAVAPLPEWALPDAMHEEVALLGGGLAILDSQSAVSQSGARRAPSYHSVAERLLIGDVASDVGHFLGREPVASMFGSAQHRLSQAGIDPMQADIEAHYHWIEGVCSRVTANPAPSVPDTPRTWSARLDTVLIHKVWGLPIFALIMGVLFLTLFWLAAPIMGAIQAGVAWLGTQAIVHLVDGPIKDLLRDGVFAGVGTVVVFVPQIALLFLFLSVLEDSGYLARAAFLMDRLLARVGLHGKSFIPLLSSFACAIPGIMATRTIESRKDRLATILIAPFMSCSARLPVYTLLIGTFFVAYGAIAQAGVMLGMYVLGIAAAAATAWVFKRSLLKGPPAAFILELPTYKVPQASEVARQMWSNTRAFVTKAGTTIFCMSVLLWALSYYPRLPTATVPAITQQQLAAAQGAYSISGRMGHTLAPVLRPLGFDWKMGVGLVGAFAAREVFVSTMGIIYAVGDPQAGGSDRAVLGNLSSAMRADHYADGRPVWTPLVAVSLLVWFALALQCMSTVAVVRRETGGWSWPIFMIVYMNALAYVASLTVYQVGRVFLTG